MASNGAIHIYFAGVDNPTALFAFGGDSGDGKRTFVSKLLSYFLPVLVALSVDGSSNLLGVVIVSLINVMLKSFQEEIFA